MRYAILTNPVSGCMSLSARRGVLAKVAKILGAEVHGLDIRTREEFAICAKEISSRADVLVVAGGDGTVSDVINAVDTARKPIAYLPLGSGNAMGYALGYPRGVARAAMRIRAGGIREYDLICCDGVRRAILASIGIEVAVLRLRAQYLAGGVGGFGAYCRAFIKACMIHYRPLSLELDVDGRRLGARKALAVIMAKHPYFGYGMKLIPGARLDDGTLHVLWVAAGPARIAGAVATSFTIGNRVGRFARGLKATVRLEEPMALQIDGNAAWEADRFVFEVLPKTLKIKC